MNRMHLRVFNLFCGAFVFCSFWGCTFYVDYNRVKIVGLYDADTFKLSNGERLRLIGIDAPDPGSPERLDRDSRLLNKSVAEITAMGEEAMEFVRQNFVGKYVRLEFDTDKRDQYGRLLAYAYDIETYAGQEEVVAGVGEEIVNGYQVFINASIIKSGYAIPLSIPPNRKYAGLFENAYQDAKKFKRGWWSTH